MPVINSSAFGEEGFYFKATYSGPFNWIMAEIFMMFLLKADLAFQGVGSFFTETGAEEMKGGVNFILMELLVQKI